mgnify:CR=1 FL=1
MTALRPPATDAALILGGGLMGLAIAHQLARRDHPVCVISRRRGEAAGFVAAGMLAPHAEGLSGDQLRFGQLSLERVPSWVAQIEADSGLPCGLRSTGIVVPFTSSEDRDLAIEKMRQGANDYLWKPIQEQNRKLVDFI